MTSTEMLSRQRGCHFLLSLLLLAQFCGAIIRNNRVILHDEHLPDGGHGDDSTELEEGEAHRKRLDGEGAAERRRRALPEWNEEWRKKASLWGQSEDEHAR